MKVEMKSRKVQQPTVFDKDDGTAYAAIFFQ